MVLHKTCLEILDMLCENVSHMVKKHILMRLMSWSDSVIFSLPFLVINLVSLTPVLKATCANSFGIHLVIKIHLPLYIQIVYHVPSTSLLLLLLLTAGTMLLPYMHINVFLLNSGVIGTKLAELERNIYSAVLHSLHYTDEFKQK